ncbi:hypothetical protein Ri1_19260 [Aeromonas dhakensis]|uniref:hypothetical protein n=1 Tax=Aeromonas dhakensis TaxID=196024 RepID=UPI001181A2F0|nr:hypothetical protein [Aeromonas dhakensis]MBF8449640.1 hypothetical protein [Aeromonas dhakensis]MDM5055496.1 hypothetical protein [Aeromonas dhakensis]MDM5081760.1 hypothetical protein [Aeromonas dhakensis]BEJ49327.1 hypothetical protein Ri1_19260 [Aeromonas dhakensis]HEA3084834.1 hypothetical protein [Aeromonas dhakensis]
MDEILIISNMSEIESRPNFSPDDEMTLNDFSKLIAQYHLEETVRCQIHSDKGYCRNPHNNGWLAKKKDGKEVLIGKDCAQGYLGANDKFVLEKNRLNAEIRRRKLIERLTLLREDKTLAERIDSAKDKVLHARKLIDAFRNRIPNSIERHLLNMIKTSVQDVLIELKWEQIDEDGNKEVRWIKTLLGKVQTCTFLDKSVIKELIEEINDIKRKYIEIIDFDVNAQLGNNKLDVLVKKVENFNLLESNIDGMVDDFKCFIEVQNLRLLCYLPSRDDERLSIAEYISQYHATSIGQVTARKLLSSFDENIRKVHNCLDFRIAR